MRKRSQRPGGLSDEIQLGGIGKLTSGPDGDGFTVLQFARPAGKIKVPSWAVAVGSRLGRHRDFSPVLGR